MSDRLGPAPDPIAAERPAQAVDCLVVGSGFGGSVAALRLREKGYSVTVIERGQRFADEEFASTNWQVTRAIWAPALRCFGILQVSPFRYVVALHGSGVGGGSLGYANVLLAPDDRLFEHPAWNRLADWKRTLAPHYDTARRMLGVVTNPRQWPADEALAGVAAELGCGDGHRPTEVGVFFAEHVPEGQEVPDPYFGGRGPSRRGCLHCGGCMVGCRHGAKNTLVKNYLYLAERLGAVVLPEREARDIRPLPPGEPDGARFEVTCRRPGAWRSRTHQSIRARHVVVSAGTLGTLRLLFRCRDVTGSLPALSTRLGERVRSNSEALLGVTARNDRVDFSKGVAITSVVHADAVTAIEPVRYQTGSTLMRLLAAPLVAAGPGRLARLARAAVRMALRPLDVLRLYVLPRWAERTTILLVMQTEDNRVRMRLGRSVWTLFRRGLVSSPDDGPAIPASLDVGHRATRAFAARVDGIAAGSVNESVLGIPMTAHILGGVPFGRDAAEGVVGLDCQVHGYPGLYVVDGSIVPANPGVNPSLTIAALAEYAMSLVPAAGIRRRRPPRAR